LSSCPLQKKYKCIEQFSLITLEKETFGTNSSSEKIEFFHFGITPLKEDFSNDLPDLMNHDKIHVGRASETLEKNTWKAKGLLICCDN